MTYSPRLKPVELLGGGGGKEEENGRNPVDFWGEGDVKWGGISKKKKKK